MYSEPSETFYDEAFCENNDIKLLTIFAKRSILDVWQGFEYVSG